MSEKEERARLSRAASLQYREKVASRGKKMLKTFITKETAELLQLFKHQLDLKTVVDVVVDILAASAIKRIRLNVASKQPL